MRGFLRRPTYKISTDNALAVALQKGSGKVVETISMGRHTRREFSKWGMWRRPLVSSYCSNYEVKEPERVKATT